MPPKRKHESDTAKEDPQKEEEDTTAKKAKAESGGESSSMSWGELLARAASASAIASPPLTDGDIDQCERDYEQAYGLAEGTIKLPPALRELYRTFNGLNVTGDDLWIFGFNVLPLRPLEKQKMGDGAEKDQAADAKKAPPSVQQYRQDIKDVLDEDAWPEDEREGVAKEDHSTHPTWLPFAVTDEYYNYFVNANPAATSSYGQVKQVVLNDPSESLVAADVETFWRTLVDVFIETRVVRQKLQAAHPDDDVDDDVSFDTDRDSALDTLRTLQDQLAQPKEEDKASSS